MEIYDPIIYGYSIMEQSYRSGQNWNDYKNDFYDLINYRNNFKTNFFYNSELNLENIDISKDTLMIIIILFLQTFIKYLMI